MGKFLGSFLFIFTFGVLAPAAELFEYNFPLRARGMGGVSAVFPAQVDALFVNPAYLAKGEEISWDIVNLGVGINDYETYQDYVDFAACESGISCYDTLYGKRATANLNGRSAVALPYFAFAIYGNAYLSAELSRPPFPDFNVSFYNDSGMQIGFALPLGPTSYFGGAIKRIQRMGGAQSLGLSTIASGETSSIIDNFTNYGVGWGTDVSLMTEIPGFWTPTFAVVWKDVGTTVFSHESGAENPPRILDNLIYSAGVMADLPGFEWRLGAELRHMNVNEEQFGKKAHFGTEFSLPLIDIRAGVSQGYQTFGSGVNLGFFKLDAAYYHVELGDYPGQTPDLRMEASLTLQISVDADFNFTGANGKRRKLKQRR